MFKKISIDFENLRNEILVGRIIYENGRFLEYSIKNYQYIITRINEKIDFRIHPDKINLTMIGPPGAEPHTDPYTVALNYYINTSESVTYLWEPEGNNVSGRLTPNDVKEFGIKPIGSFIASPGDLYLLDTRIIHSVPVTDNERTILRFLWMKNTYQEILENIIIK